MSAMNRSHYQLLPTDVSTLFSRKSSQRRCIVITTLAVILCSSLLWFLVSIFWYTPPYNPLDNYQNLNSLALVNTNNTPSLPEKRAVVSSLYSNSFAFAVAVLGHSIHSANVSARLILPYLEDRVSHRSLCMARAVGWQPEPVPFIPPPRGGRGVHHRFRDQYTKLNIWSFDKLGVDRLVYLDADTLVRRNFDELFDSPFNSGAVPDISGRHGFGITFNAGVLALRPSAAVLEDMKRKMEIAKYPLEQAEQSFLNVYFGANCVRFPYAYNANLVIKNRSPQLWECLKDRMRIVHYTMVKPFLDDSRSSTAILTPDELREVIGKAEKRFNGIYAEEVGWWRDAYERMMQDKGDKITACIRGDTTLPRSPNQAMSRLC